MNSADPIPNHVSGEVDVTLEDLRVINRILFSFVPFRFVTQIVQHGDMALV